MALYFISYVRSVQQTNQKHTHASWTSVTCSVSSAVSLPGSFSSWLLEDLPVPDLCWMLCTSDSISTAVEAMVEKQRKTPNCIAAQFMGSVEYVQERIMGSFIVR